MSTFVLPAPPRQHARPVDAPAARPAAGPPAVTAIGGAGGRARRLPRLRPYQARVARAILARVSAGPGGGASGRGGALCVEIARQGGKNEVSAHVELATLLARARAGGAIVKCAPTRVPQARLSRERLAGRAREAGLASLLGGAGEVLRIGRARAHFLSAEPSTNVVGHTADLLLEVDEAQDVDADTFDRAFRPMAATSGAPVVFYGTPWGADSLLARAAEESRRPGGRRFRVDWEQVAAHVPAYGRYVAGERARLGEQHPLFRTQYLLEPLAEAGRLLDPATLDALAGEHPRLRASEAGERYVAGLDLAGPQLPGSLDGGVSMLPPDASLRRNRDWTVLTIARVSGEVGAPPRVEVVEHRAWQGAATEPLVAELARLLGEVWRVRSLAVDATGLGAPYAQMLASRLPGRVRPVVFTAERKSRLGFGLLAAAHSGRLAVYRQDGSAEWAECRRQLARARASFAEQQRMRFDIDPAEGHDDYLMSLALAVHAAGDRVADRTARGRSPATPAHGAAALARAPRRGEASA